MTPYLIALGFLVGITCLGLGMYLEARSQPRGYLSSDRPIEQLPRVRPGPGPGGRRPGAQDRTTGNP